MTTRTANRYGGSTWELAAPPENEARSLGEAYRIYEEARACLLSHREAQAFDLLQEVLWHQPEHPGAMSYFGLCLAKLHGDTAQAVEICAQALQLAPGDADVRTNLGRVQRLHGDTAGAHRSFLVAYRQNPANPAPASELARMGVRRAPVLRFLPRQHWCNILLGKARHGVRQWLGASQHRGRNS
ncbi:MAG TPA: tetratricopeptide repeat protein [Candidatus Krumholzibacteria bacterium]|nr:tetratricopeptide repeat protein [Candidatus Krumholzibacteria bacterium]